MFMQKIKISRIFLSIKEKILKETGLASIPQNWKIHLILFSIYQGYLGIYLPPFVLLKFKTLPTILFLNILIVLIVLIRSKQLFVRNKPDVVISTSSLLLKSCGKI